MGLSVQIFFLTCYRSVSVCVIDNATSVGRWMDFHGTLVFAGYPKDRIVAAGSALKMKAFVNTAIAVCNHRNMNFNCPGNKQFEYKIMMMGMHNLWIAQYLCGKRREYYLAMLTAECKKSL